MERRPARVILRLGRSLTMRKPRKNYTPVEKVAILWCHLIDHVPVSDLCDEHQLAHAVLRLAEAILRERTRRLRAQERRSREPAAPLYLGALLQAPAIERGRRGIDGRTYQAKKRAWETLTKLWVPHDTRDSIVDFVRHWSGRTEIPVRRFVGWLGVAASKFHDWRRRYGLANEHNSLVPRDWWLEPWRRRPSSTSTRAVRWKATAGSP